MGRWPGAGLNWEVLTYEICRGGGAACEETKPRWGQSHSPICGKKKMPSILT